MIVSNADPRKANWYIFDVRRLTNGRIFYNAAYESLSTGFTALSPDKKNLYITNDMYITVKDEKMILKQAL
jgi:hypothetical protein